MRTRIVTPYSRSAGSSRVRVFGWLEHLGIQCETISLTTNGRADPGGRLRTAANHLHAAAWMVRKGNLLVHREAALVGPGQRRGDRLDRLVYDLDDAIYIPSYGRSRAERARRLAAGSDLIVAGNDEIAEWAGSHSDSVVVIPSCVEPSKYEKKTDYAIDTPRAVWIGSASTERYLNELADPIRAAKAAFGLQLDVIGAGESRQTQAADFVDRRIEWSESVQHSHLKSYDFGIMPLADSPFERGKCGYKLLQYGAAALPALGSPVGVNAKILDQSGNWAPASKAEWYDAISGYIEMSVGARQQKGCSLHQLVVDQYSYRSRSPAWTAAVQPHHRARPDEPLRTPALRQNSFDKDRKGGLGRFFGPSGKGVG